MPKLNQQAMIPLPVIFLILVILGTSVLVVKNLIPLTQPVPSIENLTTASNSTQLKTSPSPTSITIKPSTKPNVSSSPQITPKPSASSNSNSGSSQTSNASSPSPSPFPSINNNTPYVTVVSPNGGESVKIGDKLTIRWEAANIPWRTFYIAYKTCDSCGGFIANVDNSDTRSYDWIVNVGNKADGFVGDNFKVWIVGYPLGGTTTPTDTSDNNFTVSK
jgi:hypothetical protein